MPLDFLAASAARFDALAGERIDTIDMHTAGEPLRIIFDPPGLAPAGSVLDLRRAAASGWERYRRLLMFEPRGHSDMYGAIILPPVSPQALFSVLFAHNEGYSTMCGHAVIALAKAAVELGWTPAVEPLTTVVMDTPAGQVTARAQVRGGRVAQTAFTNVASFVERRGLEVEVAGLGRIGADIAYGGAYYAFVEAAAVGLVLEPEHGSHVVATGMAIKRAVAAAHTLGHPEAEDLGFLYGVIFTSPARSPGAHSRHACVFADGALDRSPTGTGVSARLALLAEQGLSQDQPLAFESLSGGLFAGKVLKRIVYHGRSAILPEVGGEASFTGRHTFLIEPSDELDQGLRIA